MSFYNVLLGYGGGKTIVTLTGDNYNFNLLNYLNGLGLYVSGQTEVTITVNSGAYVGSTSISTPAFTVSGFSNQDKVTIINNGIILGCGGKGGNNTGWPSSTSGDNGGTAILLNYACTIVNNGTIAGGGGGGGGGRGGKTRGGRPYTLGRGGGGGGLAPGGGGYSNAGPGQPGTRTTGGAGTYGGGPGGPIGTPGQPSGNYQYGQQPGGSAGNYLVGSQYVTWNPIGTVLGGIL